MKKRERRRKRLALLTAVLLMGLFLWIGGRSLTTLGMEVNGACMEAVWSEISQ